MTELETNRLKLRRLTPEDLDELARITAEPTTQGFMWSGPLDIAGTARNIRRSMEAYERGLGALAMIYEPDGRLVGQCGLVEEPGRICLGYMLLKDYWCMGLAPEACEAVLEYGFQELGLKDIWTETLAENRAWRGMTERLGMSLMEISPNEAGNEIAGYAISRREWERRP